MTEQIPERLILEGKRREMWSCPPLPHGHPRLFKVTCDELDRTHPESILVSTACARGYQGTWKIKEGRLFLVSLRGLIQLRKGRPIPADWVTGVLRIPMGRMLHHVHMGFGSTYEEDLLIRVERGIVVKTKVLDNRGRTHDPSELPWKHMPGGGGDWSTDEL